MRVLAILAAVSVFVSQVLATPPPVHHDFADKVDKPTIIEASFDQLIDHNNPDLGTFPQRYWYNAGWWNGEGSPVIFFTPGEENADGYLGYLTETTTTGKMAQQNGGAAVLMEHRYWGKSSPYQNLTSETLQYLTVEQAIADATYFAKTVDLPFDSNHSSNADNAPWVFAGGSYSGALAAWTESTSPGTFWAYAASSAPVEAIYDYWRHFAPVVEGMPTNCSKDINRVVNFLDLIHKSHDPWMQQEIKEMFGLEDLEHFDDVGDAIEYGPWLWQSNTFTTGYSKFFQFCDAVENVQPGAEHVPGPEGVGLWRVLEGYSHWFKTKYLPGSCADHGYWTDENTVACYDTYNASNPFFSDTSPSNSFDRTWWWFCCNEPLFFWQDAAPRGDLTLVARMVDAEYFQRQCSLLFPEVNGYTYGSAKGKTAEDVNRWTRGWSDRPSKRLLYVNGQYDPWRESGVSASKRPGGPMQSRPETPVFVVPSGFHCTNMLTASGTANEGTQKVIDAELAQIKTWVEEYYQGKE